MEEQVINIIGSEIQKFGDLINWTYVFTFLMTAYIINEIVKAKMKAVLRTWKRSLIVGLLVGAIFFCLSGKYTLAEVLRYVVSMIFSMFVMWDGLKKWVKREKDGST